MSIFVSGSLAYDYIMDFPDSFKNHILPDQLHILSVSFMVNRLEKSLGGTAGNIAYTIKLLNGEPVVASALGPDSSDYMTRFKKLGINTQSIIEDEKLLTASAYITTDRDDNQITAFYPGPLERAKELVIEKISPRPSLALISPTNKEAMVQHARTCKELGIKVVFDPGQQIIAFTGEELQQMVRLSHLVIGNDYEMKLLEERTGWKPADLLKETQIIITTLGEKGAVIATSEGAIEIAPCKPASVDDPTGAGDAWRAGFCVAYEKGLPLKTCGQMGSVAASFAIETFGTQAHTFTKEEFNDRYLRTFNEPVNL
jgi:adenosine kinase